MMLVLRVCIQMALAETGVKTFGWIQLLIGVEITAAVAQLVKFESPRCTDQEVWGSKSPF
jgi:hypothetical protein